MKEAKKCIEIKLMVFLEKNYLGQLGQFGPKKCVVSTVTVMD